MTDSSFNQLRFDICENVRLHTQQPSMGTLLELDLCPEVEIKDKGNHLKIEGCLRLQGAYLAEEQEGAQTEAREELSYVIPVEITLPADRAEMEHISAEIESFDYQMLSPLELQVDAILLIDGLIPEKQVEEEPIEQNVPMFSGDPAQLELQTKADEEVNPSEEEISLEQPTSLTNKDTKPSEVSVPEMETIEEIVEETITEPDELATDSEEPVDEQSEPSAMDEHEQGTNQYENDWASWLLGEKEENFTSMRIVIVQSDDTIQGLAERYEIPPSKIREVNQLADGEVEKGQIVYIPR